MKYFSQIFNDMMHLFVGTNSRNCNEFKDFYHIQSFFDDEWYNLIVPKLANPNNLNMEEIFGLIESEKTQGRRVSFYINQGLLERYQSFLGKYKYSLFGDDVYLLKTLGTASEIKLPEGYTINSEYDIEKISRVLEMCFSDWPNERLYAKTYEEYKNVGQEDRLFETVAVHFEKEVVGASSIVLDKNLNLGYLHNDGILEAHRRKGLHIAMTDIRSNLSIKNGVSRLVTIVEEKGGSYASFLKNGFEVADKFLVFSLL